MANEKEGRPARSAPAGRTESMTRTRNLDSAVEKAIGNRLRAYYDEKAREPVPDRFVELLRKLDGGSGEKKE
jgi:hypothetical protein